MAKMKGTVKLISFNGSSSSAEDVPEHENYWRLIGQIGTIIRAERPNGVEVGRVLVQFWASLDDLHLANHNEVKNSLWMRESDLEFLEAGER